MHGIYVFAYFFSSFLCSSTYHNFKLIDPHTMDVRIDIVAGNGYCFLKMIQHEHSNANINALIFSLNAVPTHTHTYGAFCSVFIYIPHFHILFYHSLTAPMFANIISIDAIELNFR